jgi:two-component system OmpR family response regulator
MRLLVVEDDLKALRFLRQGLEEEGHQVDTAEDGDAGLVLGRSHRYDVIVLDIMLPGRNGLDIARELRAAADTTPILMLTARDTTADMVAGLDAGGDDYLTKPFDFDVLLARVRALGRRAHPGGDLLHAGDVELDRVRRTVRRNGRRIELSPREFRLLEQLMLHHDQVVSRTGLLEKVWDLAVDPGTNVVDAHISTLRQKLEAGGAPRLIHTVRGSGYMFSLPPA